MIRLRQETLDAMIAHAHADAPHEACGVLLGKGDAVLEVVPISNRADDPTRYFRLDDRDYLQAVYMAQAQGLEVVGFYHSHPNGVAMPSQTDIAQSNYPDAVHILVGLAGEPLAAAWRLRYGGAQRLELLIDEAIHPDTLKSAPALMRRTSLASSAAIILSAAVAFILLVVMALALLPPAPPVPAP